ncbi:hypothetical protein [Mycoplana sp. MJR14]|uniref:hypothetical protein n=1 Tax=Mycoplana sp. MJR14 TaxID=3032583 RepID=UPI000DD64D02|nr:hypothetical protein [Mycoplana sp. MJR14]MDF1633090.1 hypothetical protein [Mycoplana sp. MJR14]
MLATLLNALRNDRHEACDTGTFADGAFQLSETELKHLSKQRRGQISYLRDYGGQRVVDASRIGRA